jgi:KDO2-lipid IV(A) lauroyltransferase
MAKFLFYLLTIPIYLVSLIPLKVLYLISDFLAFVLEKIVGYRSSVIYINLARSFPELKYQELKKIAHKNYKFIADNFFESLWSISASRKKMGKFAVIVNPEVLSDIYEMGRSVIIAMGHMGNWELLPAFNEFAKGNPVGFSDEEIRFLYKEAKSEAVNELTKWIRSRHTVAKLIESKEAPRYMISNRDKKYLYFMIADQSPRPGSKFAVNFLNQPTLMINGPEQLSKSLNFPVIYLGMNKIKRGRYVITLTKITDKPKEEAEGYITNEFARLLEQDIIKSPESWLWSHKRWKRRMDELNESNKNHRHG